MDHVRKQGHSLVSESIHWSYPALDAVAELVGRESAIRKTAICGLNAGSVSPFSCINTDSEFGNSIALAESLGLVFQACDCTDYCSISLFCWFILLIIVRKASDRTLSPQIA